jgi:hypothetical protein
MPNLETILGPDELAFFGTDNAAEIEAQLPGLVGDALMERVKGMIPNRPAIERRTHLRLVRPLQPREAPMGDLSQNFSRREFACHCGCGFGMNEGDVHPELVQLLERIREHFDAPISITSGCRCATHNHLVGGAKNSQHLQGKAADIKVIGVRPEQVAKWLERTNPLRLGIGRYDRWTHVDVRPGMARWNGS